MERVCRLQANFNKCNYLGSNQKCNAPHNDCGMLIKDNVEQKKYVRKEKWFEKYYR